MINWGILGFGNMGKQFSNCFDDSSEIFSLKGISSKSNKDKNFDLKINNIKKFDSYEDLLDDNEIDAVYISTLNNTHKEFTLAAIGKEKKILCEKPLGINYQETESLHKILEDKKNFFIEAIPYRSHPQTNILLDLLKDKEFGTIKKIEANFGFRNKRIKKDSRLFNKSLGGGAILDLGCYPISFFNLFSNNKKNIKISECNKNLCETGVDIDGEILLNINENIKAIGKVSLVKNLQNNCRIFCEKATITVPSPWVPSTKTFLEIETKSRYFKNFISSEKNTYEHQLEKVSKFFHNSLEEENFLVDINESIQISKIIDNWLENID